MLARRVSIAGSGGSFIPPEEPPPDEMTGPYLPDLVVNDTVLTQLHCHTNETDGNGTPATTVAAYLAKGYGALAITDHDNATTQPAGITTAIRGNELSPSANHIIAIDSDFLRSGQTNAQTLIDLVAAAGGKTHIAHPNWSVGMTYAELVTLTGHMGIEIHNAHVITSSVSQNPFAVDLWDDLLSSGRTDCFGFSVDDRHVQDDYRDFDIGRVQVFVESNTVANIVAALASGNFVADVSNYGLTPTVPFREEDQVTLDIPGATRIEAIGTGGALLDSVDGDSLTYPYVGDEGYVRLVAISDYTEPFTTALDDRWKAASGSWNATGGVLVQTPNSAERRLILRRHRYGAFTLEIKCQPTTAATAFGILYNVLTSNSQYIVRAGPSSDANWNNLFGIGRRQSGSGTMAPQDSIAFTPTVDAWYTLKLDYDGAGVMRGKLWIPASESEPDWQLEITDATWTWGAFGVLGQGAAKFDDLHIDGFRTYYQPIAVVA